jgi:hypothetical protein
MELLLLLLLLLLLRLRTDKKSNLNSLSGVAKAAKVQLSLCLTKHYVIKTYGEVDTYTHIFLTSAVYGDERSDPLRGRFTSGERAPGTHWIGGWVGLRTGLERGSNVTESGKKRKKEVHKKREVVN